MGIKTNFHRMIKLRLDQINRNNEPDNKEFREYHILGIIIKWHIFLAASSGIP